MKEIRLGSLIPTRDMNYVKDIVQGFLEIARSDRTIGEEINIATQTEISMEGIFREIMTILNVKAKIVTDQERIRPEKSEIMRLCGSNEKLKRLTGWKPNYSFREGLQETIEWFRENTGRYKPEIFNL